MVDRTGFTAKLGDRAPISCPDTPLMLLGRAPRADGSYGRPSPDAPLPRDPNDASLWQPGQGQTNACGTTTLAYILAYLLGDRAPSRADIDATLRRGNIFSAPQLLADYPRRFGLTARSYDDASLDLIFGLCDRGVPVMLLTDTTPLNLRDTANLHWVALVAHCSDRVGVYNPHGFQEELDRASFQMHWSQARIFGLPAWRNLCVAIARDPAALPPPRRPGLSALGANLAASGVAGVVNAVFGLRQFDAPPDARPIASPDSPFSAPVGETPDPAPALSPMMLARPLLRGVARLLGSAAQTAFGSAVLVVAAAPGGLRVLVSRRVSRLHRP
ncbi:MAG: hypothetical protein IT305_02635 [Chloroflexi bacterium]|nr:hypothetical protein [Chloroflexota bacterium]